jgi:hypothetical protein
LIKFLVQGMIVSTKVKKNFYKKIIPNSNQLNCFEERITIANSNKRHNEKKTWLV